MLPGATVPRSLADLLAMFRPCFTAPTFPTFVGLVVGLIAQTRRRTVCGMLTGAGLDQVWHHSRAHRLFSKPRWSGDALGLVLADLIVARLLPADSALTIAVDDTLFKRSGKKVFGVAAVSLFLGHESLASTRPYIHADLELKQRALDRTAPPKTKKGRYQPPDELLAFLEAL